MYNFIYRTILPFFLSFFALSSLSAELDSIISEQAETAPPVIQKDIAVLKALNKVSGRYAQILVKVNEMQVFEDLEISVFSCQERPPEFVPESGVFLKVKERSSQNNVFSGWMFASAPSLSPFEHTLFDLYVVDCRSEGEAVIQQVITIDATDIKTPPPRPEGLSDPTLLTIAE